MEIGPKNFFYRVAHFDRPDWKKPDEFGLCPFFWAVLWGFCRLTFYTLFVLTMGGAAITAFVHGTWQWLTWIFTGEFHLLWNVREPDTVRWIALAMWFIGLVVGCIALWAATPLGDNIDGFIYNHFTSKPKKEPNLFVEWLKAKKAKVCPKITVRDVYDDQRESYGS